MMQAVIMAGGKGTRLRSITKDAIPKPMAPIGGRPILEWQVLNLRNQGITDIVLVIGHLGDVIRNYFKDGKEFGVNISYFEEKIPLGTAGALASLPNLLHEESFFLIFGDILFNIDFGRMFQFHNEKKACITLFAHPNSHPFDSDLIMCSDDGRVLGFDSKSNTRNYWYHNCVNAGIYAISNEVCSYVANGEKVDMEKDLIADLIRNGEKVYAYKSPEYVKDVGTVERLLIAEKELETGFIDKRNLKHKQKAIFLDRDGTINKKNGLIFEESQFVLEADAAKAIRKINQSEYLAIVITNQPVVARGLCDVKDVDLIHQKMETLLGKEGAFLDAVYFCPHHPDKGYPEENPIYKIPCECRKPKIGMITAAVQDYNIDLSQSWMIGDSTIDIQTGKNAKVNTVLVLTGDAGKDGKYNIEPDLIANNLFDAVGLVLGGEQ